MKPEIVVLDSKKKEVDRIDLGEEVVTENEFENESNHTFYLKNKGPGNVYAVELSIFLGDKPMEINIPDNKLKRLEQDEIVPFTIVWKKKEEHLGLRFATIKLTAKYYGV